MAFNTSRAATYPFDISRPSIFGQSYHYPGSSLTDLKQEPPANYVETQEAREYWGGTFIPDNKLNPRLSALVVAICDFACMNTQSSVPVNPDLTQAYPYIMPETFSAIVRLLLLNDPEFGPPEIVSRAGIRFFDALFTLYYSLMGMEFSCVVRQGHDSEDSGLPLLQRKAVHAWLRRYITAYPNDLWMRLNIILRDVPALIDPLTETPFAHKIIPRTCFPSEGSDAEAAALSKARGGYSSATEAAMQARIAQLAREDNAQAQQNAYWTAKANHAASAARAQAMINESARQGALTLAGEWTKDAYGKDVYVESSCIW